MGSRKRIETKIDEDTEPNMTDESETDIDVTDEHESVETNTQTENGRQSKNLDCNSNNKTCNLNNVVKDDFRINHSKLTFGIDRLLKEESKSEHNDNSITEYIIDSDDVLDRKPVDIKQYSDVGADNLNDSYNLSEDEEHDLDDLRVKSAAFEAENARARLALLRYSSTFSVYNSVNGGHCIQPGAATHQTMFQPSFTVNSVETGYAAWSSVATTSPEARKDRFGFVRRVGHPYQNRTPPKRKKPRTSFTRLQILELEKRFERQKYLASTERSSLAKTLKMTDAQVKTWFQNRRTKWRRQTAEEREIERQAANRLLLSLHSEPSHRKSVVIPSDPVCLSHFRRWQDQRPADV